MRVSRCLRCVCSCPPATNSLEPMSFPHHVMAAIPSRGCAAPQCIPTPACTAAVRRFATKHGGGFWVGSNKCLKRLTPRLGSLLRCSRAGSSALPLVIDVGAGIHGLAGFEYTATGLHEDDSDALWLLAAFGEGADVHAIEPNAKKARELRIAATTRNATRHLPKDLLRTHALGVGAHTQLGSLVLCGSSNVWSVDGAAPVTASGQRCGPDKRWAKRQVLNVTTLDDFVQQQQQRPPHQPHLKHQHIVHFPRRLLYVKVDVEGAEMAVLEGMQSLLEHGLVDVMSFEYGFQWVPDLFGQPASAPLHQAQRDALSHSLKRFQQASFRYGYETYLLNGPPGGAISLVPVYGPFWHDDLEICANRSAYYRRRQAWCWNDLLVVRRCSECVRTALLGLIGGEQRLVANFEGCTCI